MAKKDNKVVAAGMVEVKVTRSTGGDNHEGETMTFTSEVQSIGGLPWRIEAQKMIKDKNDPPKFDLFVFCNEKEWDKLWLYKVFFKLHSELLGVPTTRRTLTSRQFYCFNSFDWVFSVDFDPKLYHTGTMNIILEIEINWMAQNILPPLDTNLAIKMADGRVEVLPVNKNILAQYSSYFRNLFFGTLKEREEEVGNKKEECKIGDNAAEAECFEIREDNDFDLKSFKFMIYGVLTMGGAVRESNFMQNPMAFAIVKLGNKYDMKMMVDYAEDFLMNEEEEHSQMEKLELAEQFILKKLKDYCIEEVDPLDFVEKNEANMDICSRLTNGALELRFANLMNKGKVCRKD